MTERLLGFREDLLETDAGPADRTGLVRKSDRAAFDAPAEPVEKLFFLAFDNHRITPNTKRVDQCMMRIQFVRKPVRPFRNSWNPVDVGHGSPNKRLSELANRVLPEPADMVPEANSSDIPMR